jgi:hypothetical protein
MKNKEKKTAAFRINEDLWLNFRVMVALQGKTNTEVMEDMLRTYIVTHRAQTNAILNDLNCDNKNDF